MLTKKFAAFGFMALFVAALAAADTALAYRTFLNRDFVTTELERIVGRPVHLEDISFGPFRGLVAKDFSIPKRDGSPFLRAESIRVQLDRNRLMEGKVSIASIELDRPMVRLEITKDGRAELFDLVTEIARRAGESQAAGGPIPRISVRRGEFVFAYEALMKEGLEILVKDLDLNILPYGGGEQFVVEGSADAGPLGRWLIHGTIDTLSGKSDVRLETRGLDVGPQTVAAFGEEVQRVYGMYKAVGLVDATLKGTYDPASAKPVSVVAEVVPRGISIEYANFRYKVLNVNGLMRLKDDGIEFQGMTAKFWPRGTDGESASPVAGADPVEIAMSGSTDGYVGESAYTLHFNIENLPINPKLRAALQSDAANVYDLFSPAGRLRGKVDVIKPHGRGIPVKHDIEMNMMDCSATFKPFPLPITNVTGLIVLRGDELTIENARCRNHESWFSVNGHLTSIQADGGIEVTVDTDGVRLSDETFAALPDAVKQVWKHFSPEGSIGFHWVTKREPGLDKELTYDVTVRPKGMKATFDGVPYLVSNITGEVWTDAKRVEVRRLDGEHGKASLEIRGTVDGLDADPSYNLTISGNNIPIDGDLRAALPTDFGGIISDMNLKGALDLTDLNFRKGDPEMGAGESRFTASSIKLKDGSFDAGLAYREVNADITVTHGAMKPGSSTVVTQIKNASLRVEDFKIQGVRANPSLRDGMLNIDDIDATCYDGRISGDVSYDTATSDWKVELKGVNVDLLQLTRDTAFAGKNITGRASSDLRMEGTGGNSNGFTGSGAVSFKDSELYDVPLLARVFNVLDFGKKDVFERGSVTFDVGNGRFNLKQLSLESKSMDLLSDKGYLDFDGKIRLKMSPKFHGVFGETVGRVMRAGVAIFVQGEFKDPEVDTRLSIEIDKLFTK
ncbi:MAG: AsmA-like C-terminal region-containing protein [Planctomycetota bacterium]